MEGANDAFSLTNDEFAHAPHALAHTAPDALWQFCEKLRPKLGAYLRAMLPDHHAVEDCLQETFLVLAARYRDATEADLQPLAFTCARNKAHSWLAKQKVGRLSFMEPDLLMKVAEAAAEVPPKEPAERQARVEALRGCLAELPPAHRELIEARYGAERNSTIRKVAEERGRKSDALYKKLERLRAALKRCVTTKLKNHE